MYQKKINVPPTANLTADVMLLLCSVGISPKTLAEIGGDMGLSENSVRHVIRQVKQADIPIQCVVISRKGRKTVYGYFLEKKALDAMYPYLSDFFDRANKTAEKPKCEDLMVGMLDALARVGCLRYARDTVDVTGELIDRKEIENVRNSRKTVNA